jgi:hypothetical protein
MRYDILGHPMLTAKAAALGSPPGEKLAAHVLLAETLLGAHNHPLVTDADQLEVVRLFLAIQVNFQVEQGVDPFVAEKVYSSHTKQSVTYRDRIIDPRALALASQVWKEDAAAKYDGRITSVRNENGARAAARYTDLRSFRG